MGLAMQTVTRTPRLELIASPPSDGRAAFASDVRRGLSGRPKRLSCRFLYDAAGSALFERICELPEYYLTRAEDEILENHSDEIAALSPPELTLVELGSGSSTKTRRLINALLADPRRAAGRLDYTPIDISRSMLEESAAQLLVEYPTLRIRALAAEYEAGLAKLTPQRRARLVSWLGSNIGNLRRRQAARFLASLKRRLGPNDRLLVGVDMNDDAVSLEAAYDDAQGVSAAFNANLLARINRELGGDFDLSAFQHVARYHRRRGRVEMFLASRRRQTAKVAAIRRSFSFVAGEMIHTENSHKYRPSEFDSLIEWAGWRAHRRWFDRSRRYSLNLLEPRT